MVDFPAIRRNIANLRSLYTLGYEFPLWVEDLSNAQLKIVMESARVYLPKEHDGARTDMADVKRLLREREPCNIAGKRYYSKKKCKEYFGFEIGFYDRYFHRTKKLLPNIGLYSKAFYMSPVDGRLSLINVYNAIGFAMDNRMQSDYRFLYGGGVGKQNIKKYLLRFFRIMLYMIYACAVSQGMKMVVMSCVGCTNFSLLYESGATGNKKGPQAFQKDIFEPAFSSVHKNFSCIETRFFGHKNPYGLKNCGMFPDCVENLKREMKGKKEGIDNVMFVNSWDMLTVAGNGNGADNSLDGFVGRHTSVGIASTLLTNPWLAHDKAYKKVTLCGPCVLLE